MYLYIFQNKTSGKKYLGYTTRDISKYLGSGIYWKNHCKKYGGYHRDNIDCLYVENFVDRTDAVQRLCEIESEYPEYWNNVDWCNLIQENLEVSALKGNMNIVFDKHGNPFTGGSIQRKAHAEGKHNYDKTVTGIMSWRNRDRKIAVDKMVAGYKNSLATEEGYARHIAKSKRGAEAARLAKSNRIVYDGKLYVGWRELLERTGITKYKFLKHSLGTVN